MRRTGWVLFGVLLAPHARAYETDFGLLWSSSACDARGRLSVRLVPADGDPKTAGVQSACPGDPAACDLYDVVVTGCAPLAAIVRLDGREVPVRQGVRIDPGWHDL